MGSVVASLITLIVFTGCAPRGRPAPAEAGAAAAPIVFAPPPEVEDLELSERIQLAIGELEGDFSLWFSRNWFSNRVENVYWLGYRRAQRAQIRRRLVVIRDAAARRVQLRSLLDPHAKPNTWDGLDFQLERARQLIVQVDRTDEFRLKHPRFGCRAACD